jgi:hypothetical protein
MRTFGASIILGVLCAVICIGRASADPTEGGVMNVTCYTSESEVSQPSTDAQTGAKIRFVEEDGAADNAGIERDDRIIRLNDGVISKCTDLRQALSSRKPGEVVLVTILRDGVERTFSVALGSIKQPQKLNSWARGEVSVLGRSDTSIDLKGTAVLRILALPVSQTCDIQYAVTTDGAVLISGQFYPGEPNLTRLTGDQLTMIELLLPAGEYHLRTHASNNCRYAITRVIRYLSDFGRTFEDDSEFPPMVLRREAALVREIIHSGLSKYIDVRYFQAVFLDRLWGEHRQEILKRACAVVHDGYSGFMGADDIHSLGKKRFELVLRAAYPNFRVWYLQKMKREDPNPSTLPMVLFAFSARDVCERVEDLNLAQDIQGAERPRILLSLYVTNTQANHIDTAMTLQVVISKLEQIIHRLYGYSAKDIAIEAREGNCDLSVQNGVAGGGMCQNSGYAGAPIVQPEVPIVGVSSAPLSSKLNSSTVEAALRTVIGEAPQFDVLVENDNLIQIKIHGSKNLIIKSRNYWELIYLNIVPTKNYVHAIIEASYASGVGDALPPDEAFKGNTEAEFPSETRAALQKMVNAIAHAQGQAH